MFRRAAMGLWRLYMSQTQRDSAPFGALPVVSGYFLVGLVITGRQHHQW